jgi:hypothetical protein
MGVGPILSAQTVRDPAAPAQATLRESGGGGRAHPPPVSRPAERRRPGVPIVAPPPSPYEVGGIAFSVQGGTRLETGR